MTQAQKKRLGRGLAALIGDEVTEDTVIKDARNLRHVPLELLKSNPNNPRKQFAEEDLEDLSKSIRDKGVLQPIVVRSLADGDSYEIVAGERRWLASQRAGLHEVPVIIRELSDGEALEVALIENIQRADLNALEEARGYSQLMEQFQYTQQQLADSVGKSRSHIANTLRLLTLPATVRDRIADGELTAGHARTLVAADSPAVLAEKIIKLGLSVREAERLAQKEAGEKSGRSARGKTAEKSADVIALERTLSESTGLVVEINDKGRSGGNISIRYKSLEQLDDVCQRLVRKAS